MGYNCSDYAPSSVDLLKKLNGAGIAILTSCTVCTTVVVIFYLEAVYYLYKRIANKYRRTAVLWVLGVYPVHCIFSLIGLYVPLSYLIVNLTSSTYLSIAVYLFQVLIFEFYGSDRELYKKLEGKTLPMTELPLCCCCKCLPELTLTKKFMKRTGIMVYQIAVFRPIVLYCELIAWADRGYQSGQISWNDPYFYIITATTISTLVGVYGLSIIYAASKDLLEGFRMHAKFVCFQLAMVFANIQPLIISIFTSSGVIKCKPPIDFETRAYYKNEAMLII
ncbi:organic solute transporter subunit alpha-like isoform X2 [Ptychodera flava]|uniref:organic solute transporter subunit alpha-like isoform X2 n=1 Tax=Ptychodera flava TaxID=63121 RepID=UPI00396A30FC